MDSFDNAINRLRRRGFKLTPQRYALIRFMLGNHDHPTALAIHKELKRKYPSMSFSTVYNTLNMLEKIGEIQSLHIFDDHLNYDPNVTPHIHFKCSKCENVYDIFFNEDVSIRIPEEEIGDHKIETFELVFRGTCKNCR